MINAMLFAHHVLELVNQFLEYRIGVRTISGHTAEQVMEDLGRAIDQLKDAMEAKRAIWDEDEFQMIMTCWLTLAALIEQRSRL